MMQNSVRIDRAVRWAEESLQRFRQRMDSLPFWTVQEFHLKDNYRRAFVWKNVAAFSAKLTGTGGHSAEEVRVVVLAAWRVRKILRGAKCG